MFANISRFFGLRHVAEKKTRTQQRVLQRRLMLEPLERRELLAVDFEWAFALDKEGDVSISKVVADADGHTIVIGSVIAGGNLDVDPSPTAELVLNLPDNGQFVAEYDASGSLVWATAITGSGDPRLTTLAVTGQGDSQSIVLAGRVVHGDETGGGAHGGDVAWAGETVLASLQLGEGFLIRLNTHGQSEWARSIGTATTPRDLALDSAGNVVAAGSGASWFLAKYNASTGTQTWRHDFASDFAVARGIVLDSSGRIVVGGSFRGTVDFDPGAKKANLASQSTSGFLAAYSSSGNLVWARSFSTAINAQADVNDVGVDANNNVYAVGTYSGRVDFDPGRGKFELPNTVERKAYVAKLTSAGNFAWAKSLNGAGPSWSWAHSLAVDSAGNLYVAGVFSGTIDFDPGASQHVLTSSPQLFAQSYLLKLNSDGNLAYVLTVGPGDASWVFALAPGGRILLAGGMNGSVDFDPDAVDEAILTADHAGFLWSLLDS